MADEINTNVTGRCAIVTGGNKGIGFEICKQLAAEGIMVVLTARDEKRGVEALERLGGFGTLSDRVVFHQLDVIDPVSIASLVDFTRARFGKLDILINNAGVGGLMVDGDASLLQKAIEENVSRALGKVEPEKNEVEANGKLIATYELGKQCLQTNYYAAKRMTEAFIPLLHLSDSARIVNVSSFMGSLKLLPDEWAVSVLSNDESLTEEMVDEVVEKFLKDLKEGWLMEKDPTRAYKLSKAAMNAYTRIAANKYKTIHVNCVCPGYVMTDLTENTGQLTAAAGAEAPVKLALLSTPPSGSFFLRHEVSSF